MASKNDISVYLRAEVREALDELAAIWGVSRQAAIVRAVIQAREDEG